MAETIKLIPTDAGDRIWLKAPGHSLADPFVVRINKHPITPRIPDHRILLPHLE
jgi:hypothetical protein